MLRGCRYTYFQGIYPNAPATLILSAGSPASHGAVGSDGMTGVLAGLRILEFSGQGPAPFCGMMLAFGVVAGLLHAIRTGEGQVIDCAMTEGSALLMAQIWGLRGTGDWRDERGVNILDGGAHARMAAIAIAAMGCCW